MKNFFLSIVCLFVLAGCAQKSPSQKISVTTSFYPLYFFTTQIGKDLVDVHNITPSGAEPHDYEPTPQDIATIEKGKLLILNGGHLEAWGDSVSTTLKDTPVTVVTAGENLTTQNVIEDGATITDPHIWLSPKLAIQESNKIEAALEKVDPTHASDYRQNADALVKVLTDLDTKYAQGLSTCTSKNIVTSHAAFGYLSSEFGLTQISIAGLSPDTEPSTKQIADVADFARKNHVGTIFFESLVSPKLSETIATEVGAKTAVLDPIEGISDEDMQKGANYFTIMEDNLNALRTALSCQ